MCTMASHRALVSLFASSIPIVFAGVSIGQSCSTDNDRLDASTGKFSSDCDDTGFCSGAVNGTCQPRRCRRDEFPFGFESVNATGIPPLCKGGTFCPDEGSGCTPLVDVGQPCQIDRDEQCAPPPDADELASEWNNGGAVCLKGVCAYANMTLGQPCILDVATYDDGPYTNTIIRHNCRTSQYYCHTEFQACIPMKAMGTSCDTNQECVSYNCMRGICVAPAGTPAHVKAWQFALTGISVVAALAAVVVMLTLFHKRQRLKGHQAIREYYEEQIGCVHLAMGRARAVLKWGIQSGCGGLLLHYTRRLPIGTRRRRHMTDVRAVYCVVCT
ncbi:hypothetical protein C8Q76DRAFT_716026 [Earliella scabrosa]|nr:hypothetical protein C8Q76DRAFT_716026 [Earliella scabrosa]